MKKNRKQGFGGNSLAHRNISKFYISNLPWGCNSWDVADFVKVFGEVAGVYIARKVDKAGRRFGFVSFKDVRDVKEMERALNGTKMGGHKLIANLARFAKENVTVNGGNFVGGRGKEKIQECHAQKPPDINFAPSFQNGNGRLFSELFANKSTTSGEPEKTTNPGEVCIEIADQTSAFNELIGIALVGRCKDLSILRNLNKYLAGTSYKGMSLSYMGGLSMFIRFKDEEMCSKFLLEHQTWKDWFRSLDPWECQPFPFERIAWVRVSGVPMHLADNDVINNIAEHFGTVVHGSKMEAEDDNLSTTWIGLLVGEGERIHGAVNLKWRDKKFRVWLDEEIIDWAPDSVGEVIGLDDVENDSTGINSESDEDVRDQEIPVETRVTLPEISQVAEEVQRLETINVPEDEERHHIVSSGSSENDSISKDVGEPLLQSGGSQGNKGGGWDPFFFSYSGNCVGPKKRKPVLRPRSKNLIHQGRSSPSMEDRPRKRARDSDDYPLDLNLDPPSQAQGILRSDGVSQRQSPLDVSPNSDILNKRPESDEVRLNSNDESVYHSFIACYIASSVWNGISVWCKIPPIFAFTIQDLFSIYSGLGVSEKKKRDYSRRHYGCLLEYLARQEFA
ncbi:putative RNA recognition motif domain, nucleotide-binding alpha-beta plait domain superfamily [Helianthus debilis subsp. tardiflorus]